MSQNTQLDNNTYNVLMALAREAEFLYDTIDTYRSDAQSGNRNDLVELWDKIKADRKNHIDMLREVLRKNI
jgi:rubrerythrin